MKKLATMIAFVALLVLFAASASALQLSSPTIGNDDQDRVKNVSTTFSITNDATSTVTGITFASTADTKFNIRFEPTTVNLTPGQTVSVKVTGDIPLDFNAVETTKGSSFLDEKAFVIGQIQAKIGSTVNATADLKMQAANQLEIKKARLECGTKAESLDDGDKVENLKPDTQCTLEVEVENNFPEDDDEDAQGNKLKIGDIDIDGEATIEIDDSDFDVDESEDVDSLGADDVESISVDFDIDEDVDDGTFTMDIFVEGRDDNGATHGDHWEIRLEVERLTHDIQIRSPAIAPERVPCEGGSVRVTSRIANFGKRDEDEVAVELSVPELKFSKRIDQIELDEDDSTSVNFAVDVPANSKPGIYRAILATFFDNTAPSNSQSLEFSVDKCEEEEAVVTTEPQPSTQTGTAGTATQAGTQPTAPTGAASAAAVPRARVRSAGGFTDSPAYLWLLGALGVVVLIIIIALLVVAFRKPRQDVL